MSLHQLSTSTFLLKHGASLLVTGVIWPFAMTTGLVTYPRLALTAHVQCMFRGSVALIFALLCLPSNKLITLSPLQSSVLKFAFAWDWLVVGTEMFNSWWGTQDTMPIAAKEAGVKGKSTGMKEMIVFIAHAGSGGTILAYGILLWEALKIKV